MSTSTTDPLIGRLIDGRYQVRSRIARGGMATVYLATDQRLDRLVAVKIMHGHLADDSQFKERFIQEARSAARLAHPNVVNVFDQGQDAESAYLVMEYLPGITLRELLQEYGALTPEQTMDITEAVLAGLAAAHKAGIVHRDLKPENVLLADDGRIKIGDFGLARAASANTATGKALLGTIAYLSPELVTRGIADTRSDIYAVGIMMFEMLTGEQPYKGEQPMQIAYQHANDSVPAPSNLNPRVPAEWDEIVLWATARDPRDRPADARALLDQLAETGRALQTALPAEATQRTMLLTSPIPTFPATGETQVLGTRVSSGGPTEPSATAELTRRGTSSRRRGWLLFAAVLALAGLAGGVGWWFGAGPGARVTIADVRGDSVEAARLVLEAQGVTIADEVARAFDLEVAEGLVAATDPPAGEVIDRDTVVTIVVSRGPEPTTVPDVIGQPEADARATLIGAGFELGESIPQFDREVPEGSVIAVVGEGDEPLAAGDDSFKGTAVQLIVSVGAIPSVRGLTVEAAQAALSARELTGIVGGESEFDNEVPLGDVLRVERTSEAPVRPGSTLTIIVSRGPDLVDVPNVVGRPINEAVRILEDAGFEVVLDTNVPPGLRDSPLAPVQSTDPAGGERVLRSSRVTVVANY
ncbi:Stk1 family PASTA domain-containing Ser/Thr kinase [Microcella sp.]|uniref:Stk1 family PASTA domain-containing Ser/Thr kinase n=1 Tax=Microcella sp. TaxID=1913979 RepID=UPI00391A48BC